jgi:peptide/nickel transport system permease protein
MRSLWAYIITRILLTIPMLFILVTLVFFIVHVMPGDPVKAMLGGHAPKWQMEKTRHELGLDVPVITFGFDNQYAQYLGKLVRGDLGVSTYYKVPVWKKIKQYFPATVELTVFSLLVAFGVGISLGAFASEKRKSVLDYSIRLYGITIYSIPVFFLGIILQMIFGVWLKWFPIAGRISAKVPLKVVTGLYIIDGIIAGNSAQIIDSFQHLVLPSLTLGLVLSGIFVRLTRANMLDVLKLDYILAADARGIPREKVVYVHALKNAFVPILTMMGLQFAMLMAGAVLTETTFSWPGMGSFLVEAVKYRDFPAIQGVVIFFAALVAGISLIVDITYAFIDPRVRY